MTKTPAWRLYKWSALTDEDKRTYAEHVRSAEPSFARFTIEEIVRHRDLREAASDLIDECERARSDVAEAKARLEALEADLGLAEVAVTNHFDELMQAAAAREGVAS